jgi:hypothetical protein
MDNGTLTLCSSAFMVTRTRDVNDERRVLIDLIEKRRGEPSKPRFAPSMAR